MRRQMLWLEPAVEESCHTFRWRSGRRRLWSRLMPATGSGERAHRSGFDDLDRPGVGESCPRPHGNGDRGWWFSRPLSDEASRPRSPAA